MAQTLLDQTRDLSGSEQHRLLRLCPSPTYVKQANHAQLYGDPETLAPHVYADSGARLFPCHHKAACWMSALFLEAQQQEMDPAKYTAIRTKIEKSAAFWNILPDLDAMRMKVAAASSDDLTALPNDHFALVWETDQETRRNYPLRNPQEIKAASDWFGQYHAEFNFADKHQIATKILDRALTTGAAVEHSELLHKCAGLGYCAKETAAAEWEKRAKLCRLQQPDYADEAKRLATCIREATFEVRDQGVRIKLAHLLDHFDRVTGIARLYGDGLERPEEVLFGVTEKVASEFLTGHIQTTTGATYEKVGLEKLSLEQVAAWMGEEFADSVAAGGIYVDPEKMAEILPTMPRPDAAMFDRMTAAMNLTPVSRERPAEAAGITESEREVLAAAYHPRETFIEL